jgi:peptide/nickel transport system substrate-binding protein
LASSFHLLGSPATGWQAQVRWLLLKLALCLALGAWPGATAATLTAAISAPPTADDPHAARSGPDFQLYEHLYDTLTTREGFVAKPRLATHWRDEGYKVWRLSLESRARFSDGRPVNAADVAYSLCRHQSLSPDLRRQPLGLDSVTIVNDKEIILNLYEPYRLLPNALSLIFIMAAPLDDPEALRGPLGCDPARARASRGHYHLGSGPYYMPQGRGLLAFQGVESQGLHDGDAIALAANPHCWSDCPPWSRINFKIAVDPRTRLQILVSGQAHIMEDAQPAHLALLKSQSNLAIAEMPSDRTLFLAFNMHPLRLGGVRNPLADARVRAAIDLAIDRAALVEQGAEGFVAPAWQLAHPGMEGFLPGKERPRPPALARARELLAEAGYQQGFSLRLLMPLSRVANRPDVARTLQAMLAPLQIEVRLETTPAIGLRARLIGQDYDLLLTAVGITAGSALEGYAETAGDSQMGNSANPTPYTHPAMESLIRQSRGSPPEGINALAERAFALMEAETPFIPLLRIKDIGLRHKSVIFEARDTARAYGRIARPAEGH